MGRNSKLVIAFGILVLGILVFRGCHSPSSSNEEQTAADNSDEQEKMAEATPTPAPTETPAPSPTAADPSAAEVDRGALAQKFAIEMRSLQACFALSGTIEDSAEPTPENLDGLVREEMGEVVAKNLDWSSSYIETPAGEKRLIRTEIDYGGDESNARKLKYFSVGADGLLTPIPLGPEQQDPTDALIASLETEGKVTLRERNTRAYYANGGEASYLERDGVLADLDVSYNGKTFHCTNFQCSCR